MIFLRAYCFQRGLEYQGSQSSRQTRRARKTTQLKPSSSLKRLEGISFLSNIDRWEYCLGKLRISSKWGNYSQSDGQVFGIIMSRETNFAYWNAYYIRTNTPLTLNYAILMPKYPQTSSSKCNVIATRWRVISLGVQHLFTHTRSKSYFLKIKSSIKITHCQPNRPHFGCKLLSK